MLVKFSERQTDPPQNTTVLHASSLKQILLPMAPTSRFFTPSTVAPQHLEAMQCLRPGFTPRVDEEPRPMQAQRVSRHFQQWCYLST